MDGVDPFVQSLQVHVAEKTDVVTEIEQANELGHLLHQLPRLLRDGSRRARRHSSDHVVGQLDELPAHVDGDAGCGLVQQGPQEGMQLRTPDRGELVDRPASEELRHAEPLHEPPIGAVGGEGEAGGLVGEAADGRVLGAVGKCEFVGPEELPHGVGRRGHDGWRGSEEEVDEGAVASRQLVERLVEWRAEEVEVADDGEGRWTRRKVWLGMLVLEEDGFDEEDKSEGDEEG